MRRGDHRARVARAHATRVASRGARARAIRRAHRAARSKAAVGPRVSHTSRCKPIILNVLMSRPPALGGVIDGFSFADARRGGVLERASATRRGLRSSAVQRQMRARDRGARRRARRSRTHRPASLVRTESRARTFAARSNVNVVRFAKKGAKSHARGAKIACPRDRIVVTQTTMRRKIQTP